MIPTPDLNRVVFVQVQEVKVQMQKEKEAEIQAQQAARGAEQAGGGGGVNNRGWSEEDLQLLIKAVNLFPAGTNARWVTTDNHLSRHGFPSVSYRAVVWSDRWEVIANYMNQHSSSGVKRNAKDVINKAKTLQKLGKEPTRWCFWLSRSRTNKLFIFYSVFRSSPERWD